ncbi:hypothetical protein SETIT_6G046500v2 [Setaria italica]|uniref:Uncharacterized protein n=2 Tax=Setaria TaxID=4554 RepID=A0A368RJS8_SETIT|nr:uncharacterized protein LOC117859762 [Setaria viridis]RCV29850.1 hypothetical protein SETIT_6G046500v2 [Setaria italica]TKW08734.1 hypothetical protein SEVIR_6G043700v2 [Setaria viridis]
MERAEGAEVKEKSSHEQEGDEAMSPAASAAIFAFLAHPVSLLRHVAHACAGYLGLKDLQKPSVPASSSAAAAAACHQQDEAAAASEDCAAAAVVQVRSRGLTPPERPRSTPVESIGGAGGRHH